MLQDGTFGLSKIAINLVNSAIAVLLGALIIFALKRVIAAALKKPELLPTKTETIASVLSSIAKYVVYGAVILQICRIYGVPRESLLAVASIGSIAVGLGAKGIAEDIIMGATILFENHFNVGDYVQIENMSGTIESIGMRSTRLRSFEGDVHIIPNSAIKIVTNKSKDFMRAIVIVPVSYYDNIERVLEALKDEMKQFEAKNENLLSAPVVQGIVNMEAMNIGVRIIAECKAGFHWETEREIRLRIRSRFEKEGFHPPYPAGLQSVKIDGE